MLRWWLLASVASSVSYSCKTVPRHDLEQAHCLSSGFRYSPSFDTSNLRLANTHTSPPYTEQLSSGAGVALTVSTRHDGGEHSTSSTRTRVARCDIYRRLAHASSQARLYCNERADPNWRTHTRSKLRYGTEGPATEVFVL